MNNPYRETTDIFDGKFRLVTEDNEFRMSHWVRGFGISESATGKWILELEAALNLDSFEVTGSTLKVRFRVYPHGSVSHEAIIDPFARTFVHRDQTFSLDDFSATFKRLT